VRGKGGDRATRSTLVGTFEDSGKGQSDGRPFQFRGQGFGCSGDLCPTKTGPAGLNLVFARPHARSLVLAGGNCGGSTPQVI
jgi:hypothetical protein